MDLENVFQKPPLSPKHGTDQYANNLFEKNVSEALGFTLNQSNQIEINNQCGVLCLLMLSKLYERISKIYDNV